MYVADLRAMDLPALNERLKEARTELFNLRFQAATGQLENHRQIRGVRRQIAQVLTVIQGRALGFEQVVAAPQAAPAPPAKRARKAGAPANPDSRGGKARPTGDESEVAEAVEAEVGQADTGEAAAAGTPEPSAAEEPKA
jgi:large subunit ribosomal protein L29